MRRFSGRAKNSIVPVLFLLPFLVSPVLAKPVEIPARSVQLPEVARGVPAGGALRVLGLTLGRRDAPDLELERFEVFSEDLEIEGAAATALPANAYFRGRIEGRPGSLVALTVPENGAMRGIAIAGDSAWLLGSDPRGRKPGLRSKKLRSRDFKRLPPFECGVTGHSDFASMDDVGATAPAAERLASNVSHSAKLAIETDHEFYQLFWSETAALEYIGDLTAFASSMYEREANTSLVINYVRLWPEGGSSDPWSIHSDTSSALGEFRSFWNANMGGVDRTVAHFLSGKSLGGGIAYVGVLCNASYGYGLSANLTGSFDISSPASVWDIFVYSHELGHNFNSPHTHDYCGVDGFSDPIDLCYSSSSCGSALGLPGLNSLTGGSTSQQPGTIMSYCHQVSGGLSNISLTLGLDHAYGVAAYRAPNRMYDHVLSRDPACMALVNDDPRLTVEKTGTGSGRVLGDGIDCGADCTQTYPEGTSVSLSATPESGSTFTGWSGDCTATGEVVVDADRTCVAAFASLCGNGVLDPGEACDGVLLAPGSDCGGCNGTPACTESCELDSAACFDGVCSAGETCASCAEDCIGGDIAGSTCGNGVCEAGDGENCQSCPADCAGRQSGKPSRRFCCGDGGGQNPVSCSDSRCGGTDACTTTQTPGGSYCCGDGTCSIDSPEDSYSCELDCGPPPPDPFCGDAACNGQETSCSCAADCGAPSSSEVGLCDDGQDNDCDGLVDGNDATDCPATCSVSGETCSTGSDCCSGACKKRRGVKTCR